MTRSILAITAGLATLAISLASPGKASAQTPFGIRVDIGRGGFSYQQGYGRPWYGDRHYGRSYYRDRWHDHDDHHHGHHGHYRRAPIVVPDYYHWTPDRGYHSHGTILVPHRGHYHARPY